MTTETEPVPNPVAGDSERVACKSKKGKGFRKPNTEPPPNDGFRGAISTDRRNNKTFPQIETATRRPPQGVHNGSVGLPECRGHPSS